MTLDEYITLPDVLDGVDVDKEFGNQCWDLVEDYAERVLLVPKNPWAITLNPDGNAKSAWLNFGNNPQLEKYFNQIPVGQEQKGDIMVYNGHGDYTEGHIAICLGNGWVFEQNADPDESLPHSFQRARTYLLGSLRLKENDMATLATADDVKWYAQAYFTPDQVAAMGGLDKLVTDNVGTDLHELNKAWANSKQFEQKRLHYEALDAGTASGFTPYSGPQIFVKS